MQKKFSDVQVRPVFMDSGDTNKWLDEDAQKYGAIIRGAGLVQVAK